jgi:hydroxymethylbilane synthase
MGHRIAQCLPTQVSLPAIGQGAIGIECRVDDVEVNAIVNALNDEMTAICVTAERAMNAKLNGGCQVPIAGFAQIENDEISMRGLVGNPDGSVIYRAEKRGHVSQAFAMGEAIAEDLIAQGASEILQALLE